jgi:hypothetical protein
VNDYDTIVNYPTFQKSIQRGAVKYSPEDEYNQDNPWFNATREDRIKELEEHIKELKKS